MEDRAADEVQLRAHARGARDRRRDLHAGNGCRKLRFAEGENEGDRAPRWPGKARTRDANAYEANLLDEINLRLLKELQANGRLTVAELGRRISMSAPAVAERVQRLERAGVITGYHAEVDPAAIGYPHLGGRSHPARARAARAHPADRA